MTFNLAKQEDENKHSCMDKKCTQTSNKAIKRKPHKYIFMAIIMSSIFPGGSAIRDEVYVATVPLRAPTGPPQLMMSALYSLNMFDLQHYMVIINKKAASSESMAIVCDFQPEKPEDIYTAALALSGRKVPGVILTRKLKKLPSKNCWFVGHSELDEVEEGLKDFNENWDSELRIGYNDCRDYVNELVQYLTGEEGVLSSEFKKTSTIFRS